MKRTVIAALLASLLLNSCGPSKQGQMQSEGKKFEGGMIKDPPPAPAPGSCKIVGTVEAIDRTLRGTTEKDPCGKAPCMATIIIDSVLGYGSAFPAVLSPGTKIAVRFVHSLNPTKEVWPEIQPPLPGLRVGAKFEAVINGASSMGKTEPEFTISSYVAR